MTDTTAVPAEDRPNVVVTDRIYGPGPTPSSKTLLAVPGNIITAVQADAWGISDAPADAEAAKAAAEAQAVADAEAAEAEAKAAADAKAKASTKTAPKSS